MALHRAAIVAACVSWSMVEIAYGQVISKASLTEGGLEITQPSGGAAISGNGKFVAFVSGSPLVTTPDANNVDDVFLRDIQGNKTERVSNGLHGAQSNGWSREPSVSRTGRFVAFTSNSWNMADEDDNPNPDIFRVDMLTGEPLMVSTNAAGVVSNGINSQPSISADGRFIAFISTATNLSPSDTDSIADVFIKDMETGKVHLASPKSPKGGAQLKPHGPSRWPRMHASGSGVVFESDAEDLIGDDSNGVSDIFQYDLLTLQLRAVSVDVSNQLFTSGGKRPSVSEDGRFTAFETAEPIALSDTNTAPDIYVRDRLSGVLTLASFSDYTGTTLANVGATGASISGNGRYVAFSTIGVLGNSDVNQFRDVYSRDLVTGELHMLSDAPGALSGNFDSEVPALNDTGARAAFESVASNLTPSDANGVRDVFFREGSPSSAGGNADLAVIPYPSIFAKHTIGQPIPAPIPITISNLSANINSNLGYAISVTPAVDWLHFDSTFGLVTVDEGEEEVALQIDPSNLAKGIHQATLRFQNVVDPSDFAEVELSLRVFAGPADLCVSGPANVNTIHSIGGAAPAAFQHVVGNCGADGSFLDWVLYVDPPAPWLIVDEYAGTLAASQQQVVNIVPNPTGLAAGTYTTTMLYRNVASGQDKFVCNVQLDVNVLKPDLCLDSIAPIVVDHTVGGPTSYFITREVKNCGAATSVLNWAAYPQQATSWLKIGPVYGAVVAGGEQEITFRILPQGLAAGIYQATVAIDNVATPLDKETISITLKVGLPPATLCVTPANPLVESYTTGGAPPATDSVTVTNCGALGSQLDWTVDTQPLAPWLITLPSPETIAAGTGSQTISIVYNVAGLPTGQHTTKLVFRNLANPTNRVEIPVTLSVDSPLSDLCLDSALPMIASFTQGDPAPANIVKTITNCGDSLSSLEYAVVVQPPVAWLALQNSTGSLASAASAPVTFTFDPTGLAKGVYETNVRFLSVSNPTDFIDVSAKFTVDQPPADLSVTPAAPLVVPFALGGASPAPLVLSVKNLGLPASQLEWSATTSPLVPWISFTPNDGQVLGGQTTPVSVQLHPTGLAPGFHTTNLRFVNLGNPADVVEVPLTLDIVAPKPDLSLVNPANVQLAYELGSPAPGPVNVTVKNIGHPSSTLPVAAFTVPGSPWLAPNPNAFNLDGQGANQQLVVAGIIDPNALSVGVKQTTLRFVNLSDPTDFAEITVTVTVTAPKSDLCIDTVLPIVATWTQGDAAPAGHQRTISSCGPAFSTLDWTVTAQPAAPWLSVSPKSGALAAGNLSVVDIAFNPAGQSAGVHTTSLVFVNAADPTDTAIVPVSLTVNAALADLCVTASPIVLSWTKGTPNPADVAFSVTNCGHASSSLGWTAELTPQVSWLAVTPGAGQLQGNSSSNPTLHFQLTDSMPEGLNATVVTLKNLANPSDTATISVAVGVVEPKADLEVLGAPLAANYSIGFDVPPGATYSVANIGPSGSQLEWVVSVLPAASWLNVTSFGGSLESGASADVGVSFNVASLEEGAYHAVLRFANLENALDYFEYPVDLIVDEPDADLCIVDDVTSIDLSMIVGQQTPTAMFEIDNCGDANANLDYAISVVPPVAWLEVSPTAGVLPFDVESAPISVTLIDSGLVDGEYTTTLHVFNTNDPLDFVDLPVTLTVGNLQFLPGDRILGGFDVFDASHELEFDALKNEVVKFKVSSPSKGKLQISVIDSLGKVMKSIVVNSSPKVVKKNIKIKATGHYRLRLEPAMAKLAPFDVKTSRTIPKTSLKLKKSGGAGTTGTLDLNIDMLPGGSMTATAKKTTAQFVSPITLSLTNPAGASFDLTAFTVAVNDGLQASAVPCQSIGLWKFSVGGFDGNKAKAKLNLKATQPKGTATITLPGAPTP